ncbi:SIMPL domain-containing protein [Microbacterium pseudoresistens]|uniref:SIMPL domain-containing protein n=1 Tax=Microbacterium pseudoresistens TaxID=640634 RepID=A0A7Y9EWB3_9MICO|nr:SIMPL domain-containing protein [Microbacterium pseudoresistens]NYD55155.1 hypothetical protein [Microbacterium pseudoresistens]
MSEVIITVRGEHEVRIAPERATVHLTVGFDGPDREQVVAQALSAAAPLRDGLTAHQESGAVEEWTSKRLAVRAERPWNNEGKRLAPVFHATIDATATFSDLSAMSLWATEISGWDGITIGNTSWELTPETRRSTEADVAARTVNTAVARATAYAEALGLDEVQPVEIADVGMISSSPAPAPTGGMRAMRTGAFVASAPEMEFHPDDITVSATVEARFRAS